MEIAAQGVDLQGLAYADRADLRPRPDTRNLLSRVPPPFEEALRTPVGQNASAMRLLSSEREEQDLHRRCEIASDRRQR